MKTEQRPQHILLIMLDGVGLPETPLEESIYSHCPALLDLFRHHSVPVDAGLGIPGIPQSATGQTSILTGINASEVLGHHLHGFPNAQLREIIEKENLFSKLLARNHTCTFANAYALKPERALGIAMRSVTTVATTAAFAKTRSREDMFAGQAVYHDLTREWLAEKEGAPLPLISQETAAAHLLDVLRTVDFCLFEFFLTDLIGHRGTLQDKNDILTSLDRFLGEILNNIDKENELLILISDHGNIEEPDHKRHTANPVPFCTYGIGEQTAREKMQNLTDITPRIISLLKPILPYPPRTNR